MVNQHFPKYVLHNSHLEKLILYKNISMASSLECEAKIPLNKTVLLKDSQETVDIRNNFKFLRKDIACNVLSKMKFPIFSPSIAHTKLVKVRL